MCVECVCVACVCVACVCVACVCVACVCVACVCVACVCVACGLCMCVVRDTELNPVTTMVPRYTGSFTVRDSHVPWRPRTVHRHESLTCPTHTHEVVRAPKRDA